MFFQTFSSFFSFYKLFFNFTITLEQVIRFSWFFLLEKSPFLLGAIINFAVMRQYYVCLSFSLNICLGYNSLKYWWILPKFGFMLAVNNLIYMWLYMYNLWLYVRYFLPGYINNLNFCFNVCFVVDIFMWQKLRDFNNGYFNFHLWGEKGILLVKK